MGIAAWLITSLISSFSITISLKSCSLENEEKE